MNIKIKYFHGFEWKKLGSFLMVLLLAAGQVIPQASAFEAILDPAALQGQAVQTAVNEQEVQAPAVAAPELLTTDQFLAGGALSAPEAVKEKNSAQIEPKIPLTPVVEGTPYSSGNGISFNGTPELFIGKGAPISDVDAQMEQIQLSSREYSFSYLLPDEDDFVFSGFKFSVPQNFSNRVSPLLAMSSIPEGKRIKVEIKDINGRAAVFYADLTAEKKAYAFPLTPEVMPEFFQSTQIKEIVIVAEKRTSGESGIIDVETGELYCPFISPAQGETYWMAPLSRPLTPAGVAASPAQASTVLTSPTDVRLQFNTSTVGWAGGGFTFDDPATAAIETVDLSDVYSNIVFSLRGSERQMKLEIIDDQGRKVTMPIGGIREDINQRWAFGKPANTIDWSKVRTFYFIAEGQNKFGFLEISLKKDAVAPVINRDAYGNINRVEVYYPDGRIYHVTGNAEGIAIQRYDPFSWMTGYDKETLVIPGVTLRSFGLIGLMNDGFDFLLETHRLLPDGTLEKLYSIVFVPAAHSMKRKVLVSAPSNANYVFFSDTSSSLQGMKYNLPRTTGLLFMIDLRTHQQTHLASYSQTPFVGDIFTPGAMDVSADGSHVFFEVGAQGLTGTQYWIVAQSIADPARKVFVPAGVYAAKVKGLKFIDYLRDGSALLQVIDQEGVVRRLQINLVTGLHRWLADGIAPVINRDAYGNINHVEVYYPDGRIYHITGTAEGITIKRYDPLSWMSGHHEEIFAIPGVTLRSFGLIGLMNDGFDFLLETHRLLPDGTLEKLYSIVFVPAAHSMKREVLVSAPSNPNYVFFSNRSNTMFGLKNNVKPNGGSLILIDLRSHQQTYLATNSLTPYFGDVFTPGATDVSFDGSQVFFEVGAKSLTGTRRWIVAQSTADPARKAFVESTANTASGDRVAKLKFNGFQDGEALLQILNNNGVVRSLYINLSTGLHRWLANATVTVLSREAKGSIRYAEVYYPDGRTYHIVDNTEGIIIARRDPSIKMTSYHGDAIFLPGVKLRNFSLIGLLNDGFDFLLETYRYLPDNTVEIRHSVVFVPAVHSMVREVLVVASSNPNYVFFSNTSNSLFGLKNNVKPNGGSLILIDLRTHQQTYLATNSLTPYFGDVFTPGAMDVSADGSQVFFEVGAKSLTGTQYWIVSQSIADPARKVFVPAGVYAAQVQELKFIGYLNGEVLLRVVDKNGVIRILQINLVTGFHIWR